MYVALVPIDCTPSADTSSTTSREWCVSLIGSFEDVIDSELAAVREDETKFNKTWRVIPVSKFLLWHRQ